jgi:hypothetical protein
VIPTRHKIKRTDVDEVTVTAITGINHPQTARKRPNNFISPSFEFLCAQPDEELIAAPAVPRHRKKG